MLRKRYGVGFAAALAVMLITGAASYRSALQAQHISLSTEQSYRILDRITHLRALVSDLDSGARGYVVTGENQLREPFHATFQKIIANVRELQQLSDGNAGRQERLRQLCPMLAQKLSLTERIIELRQFQGFEAAADLIGSKDEKKAAEEIAGLLSELEQAELSALAEQQTPPGKATRAILWILAAGSGLIAGAFAVSFFRSRHEAAAHRLGSSEAGGTRPQEESLRLTNEQLLKSIVQLQHRASELVKLHRTSDLLHSSITAIEVYRVVAQSMPEVLPSLGGAMLLLDSSHAQMHNVATWGEIPPGQATIPVEECWALRRGREYISNGHEPGLECVHPCRPEARGFACLPLIAHGQTFGVLHLEEPPTLPIEPVPFRDRLPDSTLQTAMTVADQIALALASLKNRETLQQQAARDPLTQLFSRGYMESELERQLRRAARNGRTVAVALLGLDHFKRFNESLGLAAGDSMLRNVGSLIADRVRREDTTCRFGGDQFALILPEASLETMRERSEALRRQVKQVKVQVRQEFLGAVTLSAGVAAFPEHGDSAEAILRAAGRALHKAKSEGRDRVAVASI